MTNIITSGRVFVGNRYLFTPVRKRKFYSWLIEVFNSKDVQRVKEIGPDRAAAEWIIRNGGKVKFASSVNQLSSYASLPVGSGSQLIEIHGKDVALTNSGLQHLVGLKYLKHMDLNSCKYISDVSALVEVTETLEHLDIGNCAGLSDVTPVVELRNLRKLIVTNTLGGEKRADVLATLKKRLPECDVVD